MTDLYKPTYYVKDIYSINYDKLKKLNINYLIFDLDNTIADSKVKRPSSKVISLFKTLKDMNFKIFIISNAFKHRLKPFIDVLDIKYYYLSFKPLKRSYKALLKDNKIPLEQIIAIGDQIFTDIYGANKMNIKCILVDKISNNESIITKLSRIRENNLIKKTKIIERGKYYE